MTLGKINDKDMRHCHFLKSTCDIGGPPSRAPRELCERAVFISLLCMPGQRPDLITLSSKSLRHRGGGCCYCFCSNKLIAHRCCGWGGRREAGNSAGVCLAPGMTNSPRPVQVYCPGLVDGRRPVVSTTLSDDPSLPGHPFQPRVRAIVAGRRADINPTTPPRHNHHMLE